MYRTGNLGALRRIAKLGCPPRPNAYRRGKNMHRSVFRLAMVLVACGIATVGVIGCTGPAPASAGGISSAQTDSPTGDDGGTPASSDSDGVSDTTAEGSEGSSPTLGEGTPDEDVALFNQPPSAHAGETLEVDEGRLVVLDGSRSSDPDGDHFTFSWSQVAGPEVDLLNDTSTKPSFMAPEVDDDTELRFTLTINDGEFTDQDNVIVNVVDLLEPVSLSLVAVAGHDQDVPEGGLVVLDGSGSYGLGDSDLTYEWFQATGPPVSLDNAAASVARFDAPDVAVDMTLTFILTVSQAGTTAQDSVNIRVRDLLDPTAFECPVQFVVDPTEGESPLQVSIAAEPNDGTDLPEGTYEWLIDGIPAGDGEPVTTRTFTEAGSHTVGLLLTLAGATTPLACVSAPSGDQVVQVTVAAPLSHPDPPAPQPPGCAADAECDDGLFCNGVEVCLAGTCEAGTDPCPGQTCDETGDACADCSVDAECDDGDPCTENDRCSGGICIATPVDCSHLDNACNVGTCNPNTGTCIATPVDSDGDGTADCNDGCPTDPNKTDPGACGCGVPDTDANGNGTPDCLEGGTGPILVLDLPTPAAARLSPCPVFASLDFDSSYTGDGSTWDQCKITWTLTRLGGLASWPAKYRYVTDPRPGTGGAQRDLATAGRGFNMAWVLTEGDWTITCTVMTPSWQGGTVSSGPIVIAPNTRTKVYVDSNHLDATDEPGCGSAESPCATLVYAFSQRSGQDAIEYVLAGDHLETTTVSNPETAASNCYVRWEGTGNRPLVQFNGTGSFSNIVRISPGSENEVWEGIALENISATLKPHAWKIKGGPTAFVDCRTVSEAGGLHMASTFIPSDISAISPPEVLALNCNTGVTKGYSWVAEGPSNNHHAVIGCTFDFSTNESVIRVLANTYRFNVLYSKLTQNGSKSCLRFAWGRYHHAYGNHLTDGDAWIGEVVAHNYLRVARFEANYCEGLSSIGANVEVRTDDLDDITICNNIIDSDTAPPAVLASNPTVLFSDVNILCNSMLNGSATAALASGGWVTDDIMTGCKLSSNLYMLKNPPSRQHNRYFYDGGSDAFDEMNNNVWPVRADTPQDHFGRIMDDGVASYYNDLADLNAEPWASGNLEVSTAIDSNTFMPSPETTVPTPLGVYDDYYGNLRSGTSWAGAVGQAP
ncbi:MAG: hypothetical protein GY778_20490 [bacterium]|nr:hypothetical protein [bacterium]